MSTNVGGVSLDVFINGYQKSINELTNYQRKINSIDKLTKDTFKTKAAQEKLFRKELNQLKFQDKAFGKLTKGKFTFAEASKAVALAIEKERGAIVNSVKAYRTAIVEYNKATKARLKAAPKVTTGFGGLVAAERRISGADAQDRLRTTIAANDAEVRSRLKSLNDIVKADTKATLIQMANKEKLRKSLVSLSNRAYKAQVTALNKLASKAASSYGTATRGMKSYTSAVNTNTKAMDSWINRFGLRAVGFTIAYKALYTFTSGVRILTDTFTRGLSIQDDYAEGVATIAGMIGLTYDGMSGFQDRFQTASAIMRDTMLESIRIAPKYRMSIEEITAAYRELAQFGVIVTKDMAERSVATVAMIKEISATTGDSTRQVRQEIQSLFNGQARATDQFARMIRQTMPEVYSQITDPAITAQEKWNILTKSVEDFGFASVKASQTVRGQFTVLGNSIANISNKALEGSGIWDLWVGQLIKVNDSLFNNKGELTNFGKEIKGYFTDIWNAINNTKDVIIEAIRTSIKLYEVFSTNYPVLSQTVKEFALFSAAAVLTTTAFNVLKGVLKGLFTLSGISKLMLLFKASTWTAAAGAISSTAAALWTLAAPLATMTTWFGTIVVGVAALGKSMYAGVMVIVGVWEDFYVQYESNITTFWDRAKLRWKIGKEKFFNFIYARKDETRLNSLKEQLASIAPINFGAIQLHDDTIKNAWNDAVDTYEFGLRELGVVAKEGAAEVGDFLADVIKDKLLSLKDYITGEFGSNATFKPLMDSISDLLSGTYKATPKVKVDPAGDLGRPKSETEAYSSYIEEVLDKGKEAFDGLTDLGQRFSSDMKNVWSDLWEGNIKTTEDLFEAMGDSILNTFRKIMTDMTDAYINIFLKQVAKSAASSDNSWVSAIGSAIGGIFTGSMSSTGTTYTSGTSTVYSGGSTDIYSAPQGNDFYASNAFAAGGIVSEPVFGIGLNSGESYSFAEKGPERVLSNQDSFTSPQVNVMLNVENKSSAEVQQTTSEPRFDGKKMIIDIVLEDYSNGGATYKAFGKSR